MAVTAPQAAVADEISAELGIKKTIEDSVTDIKPGETLTYQIEVSCSTLTALGCEGASFADPVPAEFEVVSATVANAKPNRATITGQNVTVDFDEDLGEGKIGLVDNADAVITITVRLREDLPHEATGNPITNTASVSADNAETKSWSATVTPIIEPQLSTTAKKEFTPAAGQGKPGTTTELTLTGTNTSNGGVESLTLTDPADPSKNNPFEYLAITQVSEIEWPGEAVTATIQYWNGTAWVNDDVVTKPGLANAPPADALGVRVTFTAAAGALLPQGAAGGLKLTLTQRENVAELDETTVLLNTVQSDVQLNGNSPAPGLADDDYTIVMEPIEVSASKSFDPKLVLPGNTSTVTLGAKNSGLTPLDTLTIREPAAGEFDERLSFTGFTAPIVFPEGAEAGVLSITYLTSDTPAVEKTETLVLTDGETPALPADFGVLRHFDITFTSETPVIIAGAETEIKFGVTPVAGLAKDEKIDNKVLVTGQSGEDTETAPAEDTLTVDEEHLEVATTKTISPGTIWGYKGEIATVHLTATVTEGSTTEAHTLTINDPELGSDGTPQTSDWWDHFNPTHVNKTSIPGGATLTVRYFSKSEEVWKELFVEGPGPQEFSAEIPADIRDDIAGLQFEFDSPEHTFGVDEAVQVNVTSELTESLPLKPEGSDITVENCSSATAEAPGVTAGAATVDPCPEIEILAPETGGPDLLHKRWITPADGLVPARSGAHAVSRLNWSTGGLSGVNSMTLADTRVGDGANAGPKDAVADTTFQAFDLFAIGPVTAEMDPHLKYDRVTAVELWNGTQWTQAANAADSYADGTIPKILLTDAERATTTGVRVVYEENAATRTTVDAPAVGSGVARSMKNDRALDLTWELRDTMRVGGDPVLGSASFNTSNPGDVNNVASGVGARDEGDFRDESSDIISILDRPINVSLTKAWSGGPLGIPVPGTPAADYPSGRVTLVATNDSVARIDKLQIIDAKDGGANPFDIFNIKKIVDIPNNVPGADPNKTLVVLTKADGAIIESTPGLGGIAPGEAKALTPEQLKDVVNLKVTYEGRIHSGAKATIKLDMQLRATHRDGGEPVTTVDSPVRNEAIAMADDIGGVNGIHHVEANDEAPIALQSLNIGVVTTKKFSPEVEYATVLPADADYLNEPWDSITATLTARPSGSARPAKLEVVDDTVTFWNVYRFEGFGEGFKLAAPIDRVQVDALVGGTFTEGSAATLTLEGADWALGEPSATPQLPAGVSPDQVQGLRFTFTRADGAQWENPANPKQEIPLTVHRRAYLASSPFGSAHPIPVPWEATGKDGAPGEPGGVNAKPGRFTNTVKATVTSSVKGTSNQPLTATHESTAQAFYKASGAEVTVTKTPVGSQTPGQIIPFKLTVTNPAQPGSGVEKALHNPVITDHFPTDDAGVPQLIFDTESTDPRFSYELSPGDPVEGSDKPMPTDPSQVEVTPLSAKGAETTGLVFTFPKGTVIMPGDSYTITVNMMFRPGVVAGEKLTNRFDIETAEGFDVCNGVVEKVTTCATDTEVYPTEVGALSGKKFVKADDTELGVTNFAHSEQQCAPAVSDSVGDFYAGDCVPITKPLGTETWRERVQNTGTLDMDKVITIDRLPTPGDQGALLLLPRDSQWQPLWTGPFTPITAEGYRTPDSAEYFYSSATDPCVADLNAATDSCPEGAWLPLDGNVDAKAVKHVKTVFGFTEHPFKPGDMLGYTFQTRTPAVSPVATADTVAWNSIAVGAETVSLDGKSLGEVLPTEGRRVGVALATGPLAVQKLIDGNATEHAPATFDVVLECAVTAPDGSGIVEQLEPITLTVELGETTTLTEQLPWGAACTLVDARDEQGNSVNGETSSQSETVTVGRDTEPVPVATLTNTYNLGSFELFKVAENAVNAAGKPIDLGPFPVSVACEFMGEPIELDTTTAELEAGGTGWAVPDQLPIGSQCTLTEVDAKGAEPSLTIGGEPVTRNDDGTWTFEITADAQTQPLQLELTNRFGAIEIKKQLEGNGAEQVADSTAFSFAVLCTLDGETVFTGNVKITKLNLGSVQHIGGLPIGAECGVTETRDGGATRSEIKPATVIVGAGEAALFTAKNTFELGAIEIVKQLEGDGVSALADDTEFTFDVLCTFRGERVFDGPVSLTKADVAAGKSIAIDTLPAGAECGVTESGTGGATTSALTPDTSDGPVVAGSVADPVVFTAVNTFELGAIEIVKHLEGDGVSALPDHTEFTFDVLCTFRGEDVFDEKVSLTKADVAAGKSIAIDTLPAGAECGVTESGTGGATTSALTPDTSDGPVVAGTVADPAVFTAVNTFAAGSLNVTKQVTGDGASLAADKTFTVALACSVDGGATELRIPGGTERELSRAGGLTATYTGLPLGAECELRETNTGDATAVEITPNAGDPAVGVATVTDGDAVELTVVNTFTLEKVPPTEGGKVPPAEGGKLPNTGGGVPTGWLFGGGALLLLGAVLVVARARKRHDS